MQLRFWGVRGSVPTPGCGYLGYGGNTPSVEVRGSDGEIVILDAGTGIRGLGDELAKRGPFKIPPVHIFFSHFHWDHIQGIPFFQPLFERSAEVTFYAPLELGGLRAALEGQMKPPYFPAGLEHATGRGCVELGADAVKIGGLRVRAFEVNHPQVAFGYRVDSPEGAVVYASDHEPGDEACDRRLLKHATGAKVLIYDAQYRPEEYDQFKGWGHSTWRDGVRLARAAGVKRLLLFHHDPRHDDAMLDAIGESAKLEFPGAEVAREGLTIDFDQWK